tara:strand:- start:5902 stop:6114 length:213 start_codon:yes stop_codon:yes gene_type:complete
MRNKLELLGALGIIALLPLAFMFLIGAVFYFVMWELPTLEWVFVRIGLALGLPLAVLAFTDKDFREMWSK